MRIRKVLGVLSLLLLSIGLLSCGEKKIEIGILQYATAGALDEARLGFIAGLGEGGYINKDNINITVRNPLGNSNDNVLMAKQLVRKSDLMLGIATPSAVALKVEAGKQRKNTPILYTAVTDPVGADLIESAEAPGGNVTGTDDMNPIDDQIDLARELLPDATKLGIIYSDNEINSQIQADLVKVKAQATGFEVVEKTISNITDLNLIASQLAREVDVIYVPTDNNVISAIGILRDVSIENNVPLLIAEENTISEVPGLTLSIDYYRLGYETAQMAVEILNGNKKPKDIPSRGLTEYRLVINKKELEAIGITIPQSILDRADEVYDK